MAHMQRRLLTDLGFQLKLRRLTMPSIGENVGHPEFSHVARRRVNGETLWKTVSYKNVFIYESAILGIYL